MSDIFTEYPLREDELVEGDTLFTDSPKNPVPDGKPLGRHSAMLVSIPDLDDGLSASIPDL